MGLRYIPLDQLPAIRGELQRRWTDAPTKAERRDALAITLCLYGLRVTEVCRLRPEDLLPASRAIDVRTLKRGPRRDVEVSAQLLAVLARWVDDCRIGPRDYLLPTRNRRRLDRRHVYRVWRALCRQLLGQPYRLHATRHTRAMELLDAGVELPKIQEQLGHSNLGTTQRYVGALHPVPSGCRWPPDGETDPGPQLRLFAPVGCSPFLRKDYKQAGRGA